MSLGLDGKINIKPINNKYNVHDGNYPSRICAHIEAASQEGTQFCIVLCFRIKFSGVLQVLNRMNQAQYCLWAFEYCAQ